MNVLAVKLRVALLLSAAMTVACAASAVENSRPPAQERPNIIVIMVDDMGFSDIGAYGSEIPTPHLDALAERGVRFRQFYNTGRCCPTRASLLTGLYSHQTGIGWMTADQQVPGYRGFLNDECVTIAEVLNTAGYFTAMTGKWHVGQHNGVTPASRGFRRSLNLPAGGVYFASDAAKCQLSLNGAAIDSRDPRLPEKWYGTDLWTQFGIKFIDEAVQEKKPFFLYLAHVAPHFPLQADAEDIARFRGRYMQGWDLLAKERLERQISSGLIEPGWKPEARPADVRAWSALSDQEKERMDHLMATYAAVMHRMDRSVGTLVEALKQRALLDNTLILFLSDNGGNYESGPEGKTVGDPTAADSEWFCGKSWAWLQNTPFREFKHFNHEGGIASPLIAHWPSKIKRGGWVNDPAHVIDIMATCVDLAGAEYPQKFNGKAIRPMEGTTLVSLMVENKALPERSLYWEHEGNSAIRRGSDKLVKKGLKSPWELFDLTQDRTEQNNLALSSPEKVKQMLADWRSWAERANVIPRPESKRGAPKKAPVRKKGRD